MNTIRRTLISLWLLPALASGYADCRKACAERCARARFRPKRACQRAPLPDPRTTPKYIIGDEDQLKIEVWKAATLHRAACAPGREDLAAAD